MTYAIPDAFDSPIGKWSLWDTTVDHDGDKVFLTTPNQHVDIRGFRAGLPKPVVEAQLEAELEQAMEAVVEQFLETTTSPGVENWVLSGTGLNAIVIGPDTGKNYWGSLSTTTNGSAVSATVTSSIGDQVDISLMDKVSIIFPDYNAFDTATSYVQFCSNASGDFSANTSAQVLFSANGAVMPELRLNVSAFANAGFDNTKISGVRIHLVKAVAPTAGQTVRIMAIRALKSTWAYRQMDFDTRLGALVMPVTLSGGAPAGGTGPIPLIRGDGTKSDPIPEDLAMNLYFGAGGHGGFLATGTNYNKVELYWRELKDVADGTGSYIVTRLRWKDTATVFEVQRFDYASGVLTPTTLHTETVPNLTIEGRYLLRVELLGTNIEAALHTVDGNNAILTDEWKSGGYSNAANIYRNGRVGLSYDFQYDRDAFLDKLESGVTQYAELETVVYSQRSVIDGAQLAASFSADMNLWSSFSADDLFKDFTKTISGQGSFRTQTGLSSNEFIVEDWNNTYLTFALWVPSTINSTNTPIIQLVSTNDGTSHRLIVPTLQPAQWNTLSFELEVMKNLLTGVGYVWEILPNANPALPLGPYWVDSPTVGRRRVRWSVRALANAPYRDFRALINSARGAVHFIPDERGRELELRADALTSDAWAAEFNLIPRRAQLGLPVYDQAYESR